MAAYWFVISVLLLFATSSLCRPLESVNEGGILQVTDASQGFELLGSTTMAKRFKEYAASYGKVYSSLEELKDRFKAFEENVRFIEEGNALGATYELGINAFADMRWDEFKATHLGASQNCSATKGNHVHSNKALPPKKDWRKEGIVSQVKYQETCGSCWTFSTTGALEAAHAQATNKMVLLSEQQLVDCAGAFNNFGCGGGLPSQAFEYIIYNGGLDTEEAYPYNAHNGTCRFKKNAIGATVKGVVNITEFAEDELKDAVAFVRPVSVAFEVIPGFRFYKSGVYTSTVCKSGPDTVNHAVLAVGYDVDESGTPYWIIKNSWGDWWGDKGYFKMEMGKNMCGVATCASYPHV